MTEPTQLKAGQEKITNFVSNLFGKGDVESNSATEQTPLKKGQDQITNLASKIFVKENVESASLLAHDKIEEVRTAAREGHFSLRLLSAVGGVLVIFTAAFDFLPKLLTLNLLGALIEIYVIILGVLVLLLEGKELHVPQTLVRKIHKYAFFLSFMWGRGILYFVVGSLLLTQMNLLDLISGGFMCFVGVVYVGTAYRTAGKLKEARKTLYSAQTLRSKFDEADTNGTGLLDLSQFNALISSLGIDLNRRETEAAFIHLDTSQSGKVNFNDFNSWWSNCDDELASGPLLL